MSDVDQLLGRYDEGIREIALAARAVIRGLLPDAEERVYLGWKTIGYTYDGGMKGAVCSIGPQRLYVNLYISHGTELEDPDGLLEGTGKKMRHVKLDTPESAQARAVKRLIQAAARKTRAAM